MTRSALSSSRLGELLDRRMEANARFFEAEAARLASTCHQMAERFARGGRLIAIGTTPAERSDVRHIAVEFVHPVIVGKRALPAIGLEPPFQIDLLVQAEDIVVAFGEDRQIVAAVELARAQGCMTLGFADVGAQSCFEPPASDSEIRQELVETLYHVLWELVHVFFEHRGLLRGRHERRIHNVGASGFLYPFLAEREDDLNAVLEDVRRSVLMKADEVSALRAQTLADNEDALLAAAESLRRAFACGATLLALGNGGSATDAMDAVADFRAAGHPALDLTADCAILTAIANDIGTEAIFSRQVIAYGRPGDVLLALSTSGNSANVIEALAEARRRGVVTIAMVGYDGGRIEAEQLADHVIVTRSEHIPRIQEAQASAYHALVELAR